MGEESRAIILAAGQGTRMKSDLPKVVHKILDKTMVSWVIDAALACDVQQITCVVGHGRQKVERSIREAYAGRALSFSFAVQEEQLGTAHAVSCGLAAIPEFEGWLYILYGDVPNLSADELNKLHELKHPEGVAFLSAEVEDPTGYGRVLRKDGRAQAIIEHKDCSPEELKIKEINSGLYLIHSSFLRTHLSQLSDTNRAREFYLTDLVAIAAKASRAEALPVVDPATVEGVNDRLQLAAASRFAQSRINRKWMSSGVTLQRPEDTLIGPDASLGKDITIGAGSQLLGSTRIEDRVQMGPGVLFTDSLVGEGAKIGAYSVGRNASIPEGEVVPPFSKR